MDTVNGYGCVVSWDGETLRAKGTNKFAHRALMGYNPDGYSDKELNQMKASDKIGAVIAIRDELVLSRGEFTVDKFKTANPITNGVLTLRDNDGAKYHLHFRRKDNGAFTALRAALG